MPFVTSSFLLLAVWPGATSSILAPNSKDPKDWQNQRSHRSLTAVFYSAEHHLNHSKESLAVRLFAPKVLLWEEPNGFDVTFVFAVKIG